MTRKPIPQDRFVWQKGDVVVTDEKKQKPQNVNKPKNPGQKG
jgi:hypothetical protein